MQLVGIDKKSLTIKDKIEAGEVVESYLSIRDKLLLDATTKGEVLKQPRPDTTPERPKEKTMRVINLGQSPEGLGAPDSINQESKKPRRDNHPSSSVTSPNP